MNIEAEAYIYEIPWEGDKVFDEFLKMEYVRSNIPHKLRPLVAKYKIEDKDLMVFNKNPSYFKRPFYIGSMNDLLPITKLIENCIVYDMIYHRPRVYNSKLDTPIEDLKDIKLNHSLIQALGFSKINTYVYNEFELFKGVYTCVVENKTTQERIEVSGLAELQSILKTFNKIEIQ